MVNSKPSPAAWTLAPTSAVPFKILVIVLTRNIKMVLDILRKKCGEQSKHLKGRFGPRVGDVAFLHQMNKVGFGGGALEQKIYFCLKWSKRVQMGKNT